MVAGLRVGARVEHLAWKVMGSGWAKHRWPATWKEEVLAGIVLERVDRKWKIHWNGEGVDIQSVFHARSLQLAGTRAAEIIEAGGSVVVAAPAVGEDGFISEPDGEDIEEEHDNLPDNPLVDAGEAEDARSPGNDSLMPHETRWVRPPEGLVDDHPIVCQEQPTMMWHDRRRTNDRDPFSYFLHFCFQTQYVKDIISLTSASMRNELHVRPFTEHEFYKLIGILLCAGLRKDLSYEELFKGTNTRYDFDVSPKLERYMTYSRFNIIKRHLTYSKKPETAEERQQRGDFWAIQPLIDAFNEARRTGFKSGHTLCGDESFSAWLGKNERDVENGAPHVDSEERKPQGVGMQFKNIADSTTGVMMALEICACGDEMQRRKYCQDYDHGGGTSVLMRLAETAGVEGSSRVLVADSAFASVQTAVELRKRMGIHFIGLVKTATRAFPMSYLNEQPQLPRGEFVALKAQVDGVDLKAVSWHDRKRKHIISTCGTTLRGTAHKKKRWRNLNSGRTEYFTVEVPRPQVVAHYFDAAQTIDVHNHLRQGEAAVERPTHKWSFRILQTLVGMIEVDAYLAYK